MAIISYSKCASVAAHFEVKEVFDNLIISLCKFTTLLNLHEVCKTLMVSTACISALMASIACITALTV